MVAAVMVALILVRDRVYRASFAEATVDAREPAATYRFWERPLRRNPAFLVSAGLTAISLASSVAQVGVPFGGIEWTVFIANVGLNWFLWSTLVLTVRWGYRRVRAARSTDASQDRPLPRSST